MSNGALWREVLEDAYGLLKLPLPAERRKLALEILDQRLVTMNGVCCAQESD
jgi:hypothetical protein